jgi:hypothetical protein
LNGSVSAYGGRAFQNSISVLTADTTVFGAVPRPNESNRS